MGYHRAGFEVIGVDIKPQPRYPFDMIQGDALCVMDRLVNGPFLAPSRSGRHYEIDDFSAIHASPPCQRFSRASFCQQHKNRHPDLIGVTRELLEATGKPYVIENVCGAPLLRGSVMLCGLMFGLKVFRHRWFEASHLVLVPHHPAHKGKMIGKDGMCCVVGHGGGVSRRTSEQAGRHGCGGQQSKLEWQEAMGIGWMTRNEMSQAIPPAYAEWIGRQLLESARGTKPNG